MDKLSEIFEICRYGIYINGSVSRELIAAIPDIFKLLKSKCKDITASNYSLKSDMVLALSPLLKYAHQQREFQSFYFCFLQELLLSGGNDAPGQVHSEYFELIQLCDQFPNALIIKLVVLLLGSYDAEYEYDRDSESYPDRIGYCMEQWMVAVAPHGSDGVHESLHAVMMLLHEQCYRRDDERQQKLRVSAAHVLSCLVEQREGSIGSASLENVRRIRASAVVYVSQLLFHVAHQYLCSNIGNYTSGSGAASMDDHSGQLVECLRLMTAYIVNGTDTNTNRDNHFSINPLSRALRIYSTTTSRTSAKLSSGAGSSANCGLSTYDKYLIAHSLLVGVFKECVYVFVVLGRPVALPEKAAIPTPAATSAFTTAKQRKEILLLLMDWLHYLCGSGDLSTRQQQSQTNPQRQQVSTLAVDIVGEVLLFPPEAVSGGGGRGAVSRERMVVTVPYRVVAIDATARRSCDTREKECTTVWYHNSSASTGDHSGLCERYIGLLCDVAMLDQSESVRVCALEGLVQLHCISSDRAQHIAGCIHISSTITNQDAAGMPTTIPAMTATAVSVQQWFLSRLTADVLKVLLLKCGDTSPKVSNLAIRTLLHNITAEGILAALTEKQNNTDDDTITSGANGSIAFGLSTKTAASFLESVKFLVQLYCYRFASFVAAAATIATATITTTGTCGIYPVMTNYQTNSQQQEQEQEQGSLSMPELMSRCRIKEDDLYQLCQSMISCYFVSGGIRVEAESGVQAGTGAGAGVGTGADAGAAGVRSSDSELARQTRIVTELVSVLPISAYIQQCNVACVTVVETMVREVVLGGALDLDLHPAASAADVSINSDKFTATAATVGGVVVRGGYDSLQTDDVDDADFFSDGPAAAW